jgi:hypothetical protein
MVKRVFVGGRKFLSFIFIAMRLVVQRALGFISIARLGTSFKSPLVLSFMVPQTLTIGTLSQLIPSLT